MKNSVLLIIFKRPEQTRRVFNEIRRARPPKFYVASDGARSNRQGEGQLVAQCRKIATAVDWDCEVKTLFSDVNLGSATAIPAAIDWFFNSEEQGVVLEDDCLPGQSFFPYCDELLEKYKDNNQVWWINGSNSGMDLSGISESYVFSKYALSWGWASWQRAWNQFDRSDDAWVNLRGSELLKRNSSGSKVFELYWRYLFDYAYSIKNWDYRWLLSCWNNNALACVAKENLISNIGFGTDAVHIVSSDDARMSIPTGLLELPLVHPEVVRLSDMADRQLEINLYQISVFSIFRAFIASRFPWVRRLKRKLSMASST